MDQLQSERRAFLRVVASQNKALDEALKEVEKAKKDAAKLKNKAEKEKEEWKAEELKAPLATFPPPSMYQLEYKAPKVDHASQHMIVGLAMSLEPATSSTPKEPAFNFYSGASNMPHRPSYSPQPGQRPDDQMHKATRAGEHQPPNKQSKHPKDDNNTH